MSENPAPHHVFDPITVQSQLQFLATVRDYVTEAGTAAALDDTRIYLISLAVDEITTNIITHGYAEAGREGVIEVGASYTDEELIVTMFDTGAPYDPSRYEDIDGLDEPLENRPLGGLGIYLAIQSVDHFDYQVGEHGNRHTFRMLRNSPPPELG